MQNLPRVKVSRSCDRGENEGEQGRRMETYYSSWKDPSINKDFTPGHFFKKRSLICKEQEKHFHNDSNITDYRFDFDARDWETAVRATNDQTVQRRQRIDSHWWGRRRFLMPRWQSLPPYAGSQRMLCRGTEAGRKEDKTYRWRSFHLDSTQS